MIFSLAAVAALSIQPPMAETRPFEITEHGHTRIDEFYWLRNAEDPAVIDYLEAENAYADSMMSGCSALIDTLVAEYHSRITPEDSSVPYFRNDYWYWTEYTEDADYGVHMRRRHPDGEPEILLDENVHALGRDYFALEKLSVSPDNGILAWAFDTTGGHWNTMIFTDLHTGVELDRIPNASGDLAWAADSRMVFYGLNDDTGRTDRIMRRTIGCDDQVQVYSEEDPTFWPWVWNSMDGMWVMISTSSTLESECMVLSAETPRDSFTVMQPRQEGLEYYIEPLGREFYIHTNAGGENYSVERAVWPDISREHWENIIPHSDSTLVLGMDVFDEVLVVSVRTSDGMKKLLIADRETGEGRYATLWGEAASIWTSSNYCPSADSVRMYYSSMTTPWSTAAYDLNADSMRILKMEDMGEDFDPDNYQSLYLWATAQDGIQVPVSLVYRKDLFVPGENPLLLYGYGAYGAGMSPSFSFTRLSLLDRGFVYAEAHVRGGNELGRWWYDDGRMLSKMNTFTDFIACAEYLIEEDYCAPDRVFARGESAGGLLVGAVINLRPDLWRGVIAGVPFVDVVTTMLDPTIPLTTNEYDEWGNPSASEEEYWYMLSYSPVDNITEVDYPAMYVFGGLNDSQVGFWEPAKWVAGIRRLHTGESPIILRTNMGSGHGGSSGRYGWLGEVAETYAFLLQQSGWLE